MKLHYDNQLLIEDLQKYLRINTAQPKPAYGQAIAFLQSLADRDDFEHATLTLPSGLPVLIITYRGRNLELPSLALNHHMDVVPVENEAQWEAGPFSGFITQDGRIIGRGTQDMKGVGMVHYHALRAIKRSGIIPDRSIRILCVPDEETGGFNGAKQLTEHEDFRRLNIGYVLDEGAPSGKADTLYIKIDERKPLQVHITAVGQPAHASKLLADNPNHRLIEFLQHVVNMHKQQLAQAHAIPVGCLLSAHITSLSSGFGQGAQIVNVVPEVAHATIDFRIPSAVRMNDVIEFLDQLCAEHVGVCYRITAVADERIKSPKADLLYDVLSKILQENNFNVMPLYFEGATDTRHYQKAGIEGIGFTPFTSQDNLHGTNESITVEELIAGKELMSAFITAFCCTKEC